MLTKAEHIQRLHNDPIYVIMGEELSLGRSNLEVAKQLIHNGVKIIQYREKHKTWRQKYAEAEVICRLCHEYDVTFIMNDSADLAMACHADGIHVGQSDAPAVIVRELVGPDMFIGVSTNTIEAGQSRWRRLRRLWTDVPNRIEERYGSYRYARSERLCRPFRFTCRCYWRCPPRQYPSALG